MTIFAHFDHCWPCLTVFNRCGPFLTFFWQVLIVYDCFEPIWTIFDRIDRCWSLLTVVNIYIFFFYFFDRIFKPFLKVLINFYWLFMTVFDHFWPYLLLLFTILTVLELFDHFDHMRGPNFIHMRKYIYFNTEKTKIYRYVTTIIYFI